MTKNRREFLIGNGVAGVLIFIGILYLSIPLYYGKTYETIAINNLFISFTLCYALLYFVLFLYRRKKEKQGALFFSMSASVSCLLDVILMNRIDPYVALMLSNGVFLFSTFVLKWDMMEEYRKKELAIFYLELYIVVLYAFIGMLVTLSFSIKSPFCILILGFYILLLGVLESFDTSIRCLLRAGRIKGKGLLL